MPQWTVLNLNHSFIFYAVRSGYKMDIKQFTFTAENSGGDWLFRSNKNSYHLKNYLWILLYNQHYEQEKTFNGLPMTHCKNGWSNYKK